MQEKNKKELKELARELINVIKSENYFHQSVSIKELTDTKETKTIRIFKVTSNRLSEHCKDKVVTPSQFASIAIEEKIKKDKDN